MDIMIIIVAIAAIAVLGYMLMAADKKNSQLAASVQAMAAAKAAAEAQLAEADELLTAVLFVPMGGKFFRFLVIVKVFAGFCLRTRKKMI